MSTVTIRNVSKRFPGERQGRLALDNISLEARSGEFLMLVGPSGCGKSTLLNIIAGLDRSDSGVVLVDGVEVTGPHPDRSLVFQDGALFPWLTVQKNVEFGLARAGFSRKDREDRARSALTRVGLGRFAHSATHELSGGMRQRVAIARSLVLDPKVLLMDEPFAALDDATREELHSELQDLWRERGTTIVFVTHNVREAVALGDRVVLLSAAPGRIKASCDVDILRPRFIDDPDVAGLAVGIAHALKSPPPDPHEHSQTNSFLRRPLLGLGDSC